MTATSAPAMLRMQIRGIMRNTRAQLCNTREGIDGAAVKHSKYFDIVRTWSFLVLCGDKHAYAGARGLLTHGLRAAYARLTRNFRTLRAANVHFHDETMTMHMRTRTVGCDLGSA
jgi:hypothetical protein